MALRPLLLLASACLSCLSTGPGDDLDAGRYDAGPPPCVPKAPKAACIELPLDSGNELGSCVAYTGSAYTAANVEPTCASGSLTTCPTAGRVGGSCVVMCGEPGETVQYDYGAISASGVATDCKNSGGTYLPP